MMNSIGNGGNRRLETRLLVIIDRELRRRILRNERQIIPETLRFEQPQQAPLLECLRHTTRDEAQLPARQASSQGLGHTRQGLEDW